MATAGEKIYEWDRQPRMPVPPPPRGSCDCQFHIYARSGEVATSTQSAIPGD